MLEAILRTRRFGADRCFGRWLWLSWGGAAPPAWSESSLCSPWTLACGGWTSFSIWLLGMRNDADDDVTVIRDLEIKSPVTGHSALPDVVGLIDLLGHVAKGAANYPRAASSACQRPLDRRDCFFVILNCPLREFTVRVQSLLSKSVAEFIC